MKMKVVALVLIACLWLAMAVGVHSMISVTSRSGHPDENHHNIPRERYNQWGSSTGSGDDVNGGS